MTPRFSEECERTLRRVGWYPGRAVDVEPWRVPLEESGFVFPEAVVRFLTEFNGLSFPDNGRGISRAREAFEFDPLLLVGEEERFSAVGAKHGLVLAPLGELDHGRFYLGMDEHGAVYDVTDTVAFYGVGDAGLESLVLGVMPAMPEERFF
ncbi:SUKH-3 domain-containing protein [Lentzea sp. NPDC092896]|uniref:SUKH-3 domain-containing protein n=1 Tax=Lentzea sp. NPDC092896 TaxID=3364127 RepID=UPI00381F8261